MHKATAQSYCTKLVRICTKLHKTTPKRLGAHTPLAVARGGVCHLALCKLCAEDCAPSFVHPLPQGLCKGAA
jgi:hypothetical protein